MPARLADECHRPRGSYRVDGEVVLQAGADQAHRGGALDARTISFGARRTLRISWPAI